MPPRRSRSAQVSAAAIAIGALFAVAAPAALADQLTSAGGTLTYQASSGENSQIAVLDRSGQYEIDESGGQISLPLPSGCTSLVTKVKCPSSGLSQLVVNLGDGTDSLDLSPTSLPTTVNEGPGAKAITGGSGNDVINAANGYADQISCGAGVDAVSADSQDTVAADCEQVSINGGAPSQGTGAIPTIGLTSGTGTTSSTSTSPNGSASNSSFGAPIGLVLPANLLTLTAPSKAVVTIGCSATAPDDCRGDLYLEVPASLLGGTTHGKLIASRGHYLNQQRRISQRKFNIARGKKIALPMRIAFRGHYAEVVRRRRLRGTLRIVQRDRAGNIIGTATRSVILHVASNKWSRKRPNRRPRKR
jgi:hypothetical protein